MDSEAARLIESMTALIAHIALHAPDKFPYNVEKTLQNNALCNAFQVLSQGLIALAGRAADAGCATLLGELANKSLSAFEAGQVREGLVWLQCLQDSLLDTLKYHRSPGPN